MTRKRSANSGRTRPDIDHSDPSYVITHDDVPAADGRRHEQTASMLLADNHYKMLVEESGIDPEVIDERGYATFTDSKQLSHFQSTVQKLVPGLHIPSRTVDGEPGPPQYRPDKPRVDGRSGKEIKYETQYRAKLRLDVHPRNLKRILNSTVPLYITEGVKKADSATSRGLCVIALSGVDCWMQDKKPHKDSRSRPHLGL